MLSLKFKTIKQQSELNVSLFFVLFLDSCPSWNKVLYLAIDLIAFRRQNCLLQSIDWIIINWVKTSSTFN